MEAGHAAARELDAPARAIRAHDDIGRDVAGIIRTIGRAGLRRQRAHDVDGHLDVGWAHALGRSNFLDARICHVFEVRVDDASNEAFVNAAPLRLQAQAFRERARADTGGLERLNDGEDFRRLCLRRARRAGSLRKRHGKIAALVNGADKEDRNGLFLFAPGRISELDLLEKFFFQRAAHGLCLLERARLAALAAVPAVTALGAAEIARERRDVLSTVRLLAFFAYGIWRSCCFLKRKRRMVVVDFERGIFQILLLNQAAQLLRWERKDLDGLLHLHRHGEMLGKVLCERL